MGTSPGQNILPVEILTYVFAPISAELHVMMLQSGYDVPWITSHEPTLLHAIVVAVSAIIVTYPLSYLLILSGAIKADSRGKNKVLGAFYRANSIVREQFLLSIFAWVVASGVGFLAMFGGAAVAKFIAKAGVIYSVEQMTKPAMYTSLGLTHVITQGIAYRVAVHLSAS